MTLSQVLKLLHEKYPDDYEKGMWPALVVYDDESGQIVKDMSREIYSITGNSLFVFKSLAELYTHLEGD